VRILLTVLFAVIAYCALTTVIMRTVGKKIARFDKIYDPDEKIIYIEGLQKRFGGRLWRIIGHLQFSAYGMLICAYAEKGDHEKALAICEESLEMFPENTAKPPYLDALKKLTLALKAWQLMDLKRFEEAEEILSGIELPEPDNPPNTAFYCHLKLYKVYLAAHNGEYDRAREIIAEIAPKYRELGERQNRPDFMCEICIAEAGIAKEEGNLTLAKEKYEAALAISKNYGVDRIAKNELEEINAACRD